MFSSGSKEQPVLKTLCSLFQGGVIMRQARLGIVWNCFPSWLKGSSPYPTGEMSQVMMYCLPTSKFNVV
jgi:hypothetical protein